MTAGDKGSADLPRAEIAAIRRAEAQRGADALGALGYTCLEFRDLEITFENASRRRVSGLLRALDPQLVFTTPPVDYMFDHEITSQLVRDACFNAAVPNYESDDDQTPTTGIPTLYYTDAIGGHDLYGDEARVDCIVDVTNQMPRKLDALSCHESQRAWLRRQHGLDEYLDATQRWCAVRGDQIGAEYGEGFTLHRGHPHPSFNLLATMLGAIPPRKPMP